MRAGEEAAALDERVTIPFRRGFDYEKFSFGFDLFADHTPVLCNDIQDA